MSLTFGTHLQVPDSRRKSSNLTVPGVTTDPISRDMDATSAEQDSPTSIQIAVPNHTSPGSVQYKVQNCPLRSAEQNDIKNRLNSQQCDDDVCDDDIRDIQLIVPKLIVPSPTKDQSLDGAKNPMCDSLYNHICDQIDSDDEDQSDYDDELHAVATINDVLAVTHQQAIV